MNLERNNYRPKILLPFNGFWKMFSSFNRKIKIDFETKKYQVKTASNVFELAEVFKLRRKIFFNEIVGMKNKIFTIDYDEYDYRSDHLIIRDIKKSKIIATYRLNSNIYSADFYSETEFNLKGFLKSPGVKLELGRACIHKKYRCSKVLNLLWKGIGEYSKSINAQYLFGTASLFDNDFKKANILLNTLREKNYLVEDKFGIHSWQKINPIQIEENEGHTLKDICPKLLRSYLKAGAKVHGKYFFDEYFQCFDFLVLLDLDVLSKSFKKRYWEK